jgi:hypothetical protein
MLPRENWINQLLEERRRKQETAEIEKRQDAGDARETRREERETHNFRINLILCAFAALASGAAIWQGYESHKSRIDAQDDFKTTRKDAADSAAQARQDALDAIQKQLDASRELKEQAARSAAAAEALANTTTQSLHVSERAFVSITPILGRAVRPAPSPPQPTPSIRPNS